MNKLILPILALLLLALPVSAQTPIRLTMAGAIDTAIRNNRDVQVQRLEIDNAESQVTEAFGNALPTLNLTGRYTRNLQKQVFYFPGQDGIVRPISVGSDNAVVGDLMLNQVVFNSAIFTGVGTARTYAQISRQQLRAKTSDIVLATRRAYLSAVFAGRVLNVNEILLTNGAETLRNAQALYRAGLRAEFDTIRAAVQYANQEPLVVQARDNYELAIVSLKNLLGYDDTQQIILVDSLPAPTDRVVVPAIEQAKGVLEQYNPTLQTLRLNTEVNKGLIDVARSDYLPTVSFIGDYSMQAQADNFGDLSFQPTSYVGLNLSLNLFNGYKTDANVEQARIAYEKSRLQLAQAESGLKTQLESILRRIEYARRRIDAGGQTIYQAQRAYQISTTSYKAGTGTQLQINDAGLALAQSQLNQINAVYDYNVAIAELEQVLGDHYVLDSSGKDVNYVQR